MNPTDVVSMAKGTLLYLHEKKHTEALSKKSPPETP